MSTCLRLTSLWAVLLSLTLAAQNVRFELKTDKADAIYAAGEPVVFSATLLKEGKISSGDTVRYELQGDGGLRQTGTFTTAENPYTLTTSLDFPGWLRVFFTLLDQEGKPVKTVLQDKEVPVTAGIGAMVAPLELKAAGNEPADFDAFWGKVRRELDAVPVRATLTPVELPATTAPLEAFDVKIDCIGGKPVSGYLIKLKNAPPRSLPALVSYHGAGVRSAYKPVSIASLGYIALDVNAHGIENGQPAEFYAALNEGELKNYRHAGKEDKETFYFRAMYARVMRALDYIKTLPEWDGQTLVVSGGSQGGAQAIVAAALDSQVTLCLAGVPALSEHAGVLAVPPRESGWPRLYAATADGQPDNPAVALTAAYFDNVHFARRIRCEAYLSTGFIDRTCPPTGVYAAFNAIPADVKKFITTTPAGGHSAPNTLGQKRLQEIARDYQQRQRPAQP